jgi:hypothetical protein
MNAAKILNVKGRYFYGEHTPMPMKKSDFEKYFADNPQAFLENANHKFRHPQQFNIQSFTVLYNFLKQKLIARNSDCFLYINHVKRGEKYIQNKIQEFKNNPKTKYCCIGSLDLATENNQNLIFNWLQETIGVQPIE